MTDEEFREAVAECFQMVIQTLFVPGVHNYYNVQRLANEVHSKLIGKDRES